MKRQPEQLPELSQDILKNSEYLLKHTTLDKSKKPFITDYERFQHAFNNTILDLKITTNSDDSAHDQANTIIAELAKFSSTKIRNELLREYRTLCASLRVLNLFSLYQKFFLSPYDNKDLLEKKFDSNPDFQKLNQTLGELFRYEDQHKDLRAPLCKGHYYSALKGIDYVGCKTMTPSGIEVGNFRELSQFFAAHPLIRNFFDDNLEEITRYAILFYGEKPPSPPYQKPPEDIKKIRTSTKRLKKCHAIGNLSAGLAQAEDSKPAATSSGDIDVPSLLQHSVLKKTKLNSKDASQITVSPIPPVPSKDGLKYNNGF